MQFLDPKSLEFGVINRGFVVLCLCVSVNLIQLVFILEIGNNIIYKVTGQKIIQPEATDFLEEELCLVTISEIIFSAYSTPPSGISRCITARINLPSWP